MRIVIGILFSILVSSCDTLNDGVIIEQSLKEIALTNHCEIKFEYENSTNNTLKVKISGISNDFTVGNLMIEIYTKMIQNSIEIEEYSFESIDVDLSIQLTKNELNSLILKKKNFEEAIQLLVSRNDLKFYNLLSEGIKKESTYEDFTKNFNDLVSKKYEKFEGFVITNFENEKYVIFKVSNNKKYAILSFKLNSNEKTIYAVELV